MPSPRTLSTLAAALLGVAAAVGAAPATVDLVCEPPLATAAEVRLSLDGVPATVEAVEQAQPPALVAVAVDASLPEWGADAVGARTERLVAALRSAGSAVLVAEIGGRLVLRTGPSQPSPELAEVLAEVLRERFPTSAPGGSAAGMTTAITELRAAGGTATATVEVEALRRRVEAHSAAARLAALRRIAALEALVRRLSAMPGRKTVLLLGDGLEARPGAAVAAAWREAFPELPSRTLEALAASPDVELAMAGLERLAAAHRVAFYPLVATGSFGERLAEATGGHAVEDDRLGTAAEPAHPVHFAAESPAAAGSAALEAGRSDGGTARAPRRWARLDPLEEVADHTLGAVELGLAENPLGIEAAVQPPRAVADGSALVPILVTVPVSRLELRPEEGVHTGRVSVLTAVAGDGTVGRREFPFEVPRDALEQALTSRAGFVVGVTLAPGRHLVAVGLCDLHTSSWATTLVSVSVPAAGDAP